MLQTAAAKVQNRLLCTKYLAKKCTLQFELLTTYYSKSPCKMSYTPNFRRHVKGLAAYMQRGHAGISRHALCCVLWLSSIIVSVGVR